MESGEASLNAFVQSMYYIGLRNLPDRTRSIANDLFNTFGFGFDAAQGSQQRGEMIWGVAEPSTVAAFDAYRRGRLSIALEEIEIALGRDPNESASRQLHWLRGMVYYVKGQFDRAAEAFHVRVSSAPNTDDDHLILALILSRIERLTEASTQLAALSGDQKYERVVVRSDIVRALIAAQLRDHKLACQHAEVAFDTLVKRDSEIRKRLNQGLAVDEPFRITQFDLSSLAIETAMVYVNGGAIIDHEAPRERRLVAVEK